MTMPDNTKVRKFDGCQPPRKFLLLFNLLAPLLFALSIGAGITIGCTAYNLTSENYYSPLLAILASSPLFVVGISAGLIWASVAMFASRQPSLGSLSVACLLTSLASACFFQAPLF